MKIKKSQHVVFIAFFIVISIVSIGGVSTASAIATQEEWFLNEFHSGRGMGVSGPYTYVRTMNFAEIASSGDLIRRGERGSDTQGSMDWSSLDRVLNTVTRQGKILVLGLWVVNFETVTESGIRAFLTRLSDRLQDLNTYVIWIPAWEFNQHEDWGRPQYNWGLGTAGSPRYWYIDADIYVEKMKMIRRVRDSLGIENVLIGAQPDSLFRYTYNRWEGMSTQPVTGQRMLVNYREGIAQADIIGCTMYVGQDREDSGLYDINIIKAAFGRMHQIHDYIDPTKPFFAFEYNSMSIPIPSHANTFFIENTYKQIPNNFDWGLRGIIWWCPFDSNQAWETCSYWAGQYDGFVGSQQYTLTVNVVGSGSINVNPEMATYTPDTEVTLTAVPASGWMFSGWSGDTSGSYNPTTITMDGDKAITATFIRPVPAPGETPTWTYFNFMPNPTTQSNIVTLKGILVDDFSNPITDATIVVDYSTNDGSSWNRIWTLTTNEYGMFSNTFSAPETGRYLTRISYEGDSTYMPSSNIAYLIVQSTNLGVEGSTLFNFNPNPSTSGNSVSMRGILLDEFNQLVTSATVTVEYSTDHGTTWRSIWTLTTNQYGIFYKSFTTPGEDTYLVRINHEGTSVTTYFVVP